MSPDEKLVQVLIMLPDIIKARQTSFVQQDRPIKWDAYNVFAQDGTIYVKRTLCDRCQKVTLPDEQLIEDTLDLGDIGKVHILTGICRNCIQTKEYDKYLDGKALVRQDAGKLWVKYLTEYEDAWEQVLRSNPVVVLTEKEWLNICKYFNGCALCGGPIQVRALFFPSSRGGAYTPWNVIPLCEKCRLSSRFSRRRDFKNKNFDPRKNFSKGSKIFKDINLFYKTKTMRMFVLNQMRKNDICIDTLMPYMKRFFETKVLDKKKQK